MLHDNRPYNQNTSASVQQSSKELKDTICNSSTTVARDLWLFSTINTMATVVELFYILPPYLIGQRRFYNYHETDRKQ